MFFLPLARKQLQIVSLSDVLNDAVERERTESIAGSDFSVVSKVQNYKLCVQGKPICPVE